MKTESQTSGILLLTGTLLIYTIALVLVISSIALFTGTGISAWQLPVSFLIAGIICYSLNQPIIKTPLFFLRPVIASLVIIALCVAISLYFYDVSYDGQSYHQEAIYQLKNGWNPFHEMLPESIKMAIYINHYSKGVELPQSALYSIIPYIEVSKATNFILWIATACILLSWLLTIQKLSRWKCILITLIAVGNPVVVTQLISTYVDGQLAIMLLCFLATVLWIVRNPGYANLLLLASVIIITSNIKFTGLVYIVLFSFFLLAWLVFTKRTLILRRVFLTSIISGLTAVLLVGFNPYYINTTQYKHPFYPLMGSEKVDIIGYNLPAGFEDQNGFMKFTRSIFGRTDNIMPGSDRKAALKMPFTFQKSEISNAAKVDTRVAGFGPLFSGILLLSFALLVMILLNKQGVKPDKNAYYILAVIVISVIVMPESWWARYIPQLWYFPVIILLLAELNNPLKYKYLNGLIYLLFIGSIAFSSLTFGWNFMMTKLVDYQLSRIKQTAQPVQVEWGSAQSNRIRFDENQIRYQEVKFNDDDPGLEFIIRSDSRFRVPANIANPPKSKIIQWAEKFQTVENQ